jgi:hypothetical protein
MYAAPLQKGGDEKLRGECHGTRMLQLPGIEDFVVSRYVD